MTKRKFLDTVFALAPNEANAIMDAFDEYVDSNEPHWIPVTEDISYIISETLHECGIYGEEATVKLIGTLKRLGRDDLLPPCVR